MPSKPDARSLAFINSLERGLQETLHSQGGMTTPGGPIASRNRGRPVNLVHKQPVTLRLDSNVLARWRASGKGWQTRAAAALAAAAP